MSIKLADSVALKQLCTKISTEIDTEIKNEAADENTITSIIKALKILMPELDFNCVLSRGHWYRLGGVVDRNYQEISNNIAHWAENECNGNIEEIILKHLDSRYFVTRFAGKTHYFTASYGVDNIEFMQLEIEQLKEVIDRPLIDKDWFPDCLEDFIDPLDFPKLEPEATGKQWFQFRRITDISSLMKSVLLPDRTLSDLNRFFQEWNQSSACDEQPFCHYWILALREYQDSDREQRLRAKVVSTYAEKLPQLPPGNTLHGTELSKAIHNYDRQLGYPFAWYFSMLTNQSSNYELAEAVLRDQMGAYEYLPAKDLKILRHWEERPYGI